MFIAAILIICLAHIVRVMRWELLIGTYEKPSGKKLMKALSLGYFINFFIPFKLGDVIRALYAGKSMKNGRGFSLATVIVERCIDVISVGVIFGTVYFLDKGMSSLYSEITYYAVLGIFVLFVLIVLFITRNLVKRIIGCLAALFNTVLEEKILRFMWALIWGFKDIILKISKPLIIFETIIMWGLYITSYRIFAFALSKILGSVSFLDVFVKLFSKNTLASSGFSLSRETMYYWVFLLVPSIVLFLIVKIIELLNFKIDEIIKIFEVFKDKIIIANNNYKTNLIPQTELEERRKFLKFYFSGKDKEYIEDYLRINRNIMILRDFSAGSRATTILCTDGSENFYRKYAFSDDAAKLSMQIKWIETFKDVLKLPKIIKKDITEVSCFYDMPYMAGNVTMFDYVHTNDKTGAWKLIEQIISDLEKSVYTLNFKECDSAETIESYIEEKIVKNIEKIIGAKVLKDIVKYEYIYINGTKYRNISSFKKYFDKGYLLKLFSKDPISDIHGDLTAENIICTNEDSLYYVIDPNTGNIHNTKFIDLAKLLQSFHGGYEFYKRCFEAQLNENAINYSYIKSDVYTYMNDMLKEYLIKKYNKKQLESIYMHEIVNWLRLLPYQIDKGNGLLFYAGLIIILNDVYRE